MKKIGCRISSGALLLFLAAPAYAENIDWIHSYSAGIKAAREAKKPILLDFWAVWCAPCRKMDVEVYGNSKMIEAAKGFITIQVDIDQDRATAAKFNVKALPNTIVLDPYETVLQRREGFANISDLLEMTKPIPRDFSPVIRNFQALEQNREDFDALLGLGSFYQKSGIVPAAHDFFDRALKSQRAREDRLARDRAQIALGFLALSASDTKEARKVFEQACKDCDPKNEPYILLALGKTYIQMKKAKEAREVFEQVASRFPRTEHARIAQDNLQRLK